MNQLKNILNFFLKPYRPHTSRTVRFAFPLIFAVGTLLGASVIDTNNQSFLHIESSAHSVREGEQFEIDVYVSAHIPVNAVDIALSFPDIQVEVLSIDIGESVITLWTEKPYIENNTVILRGGTFRKGFKGDHLIATINVKAHTSGLATFEITDSTLLAGDGSGSEVLVSNSGEESVQLYIANKNGTFTTSSEHGASIGGVITVRIVTDIDGDGSVSLSDLSKFMSAWVSGAEIYDFSGDGHMTFRDFAIILSDSFFK